MLPFPPDAIVFDMDGLLFELGAVVSGGIPGGGKRGQVQRRPRYVPPDARQILAGELGSSLCASGASASADELRALWQRQFEQRLAAGCGATALKTGARELIDLAVTAGLPIAIATSSSSGIANTI